MFLLFRKHESSAQQIDAQRLTGLPVGTGPTLSPARPSVRASGNQHITSCRKMLTIKIATDMGIHEGEGAKISPQILPGESQKHYHSSVLGDTFPWGHISHFLGFCHYQASLLYFALQHSFLKGSVGFLYIFKYAPAKSWEVFCFKIQRMWVLSKITGGKIKLMSKILNCKFSHHFFFKLCGVSYYLPNSNHKMNKQVASKH